MRRRASDFLPHRPPMLCIDEVGEEGSGSVVCYTTIRPDFIFLDGDAAGPLVLIELCAQACAVVLGLEARRAGQPPAAGVLAGCREAELLADRLEVGDELTIAVERVASEPPLSAFTGTVSRLGAVIARVSLSVVEGPA
jgi:predicted hotdog family 3-hydroxylacyl-ACP dehydratase